ncbi:unnamed protein product [Heterobilharzia americana]|nr:unnamed protein product [Heterobilharzia americana]
MFLQISHFVLMTGCREDLLCSFILQFPSVVLELRSITSFLEGF